MIVGESEAIRWLRREVEMVAPSDLSVLIIGETGVGKELVARSLSGRSRRRGGPMVMVNCAALSEHLAESELFGHVAGAFTGAEADRAGRFERARGGTLFLDEVGELSPQVQAKLLRVLETGEIQRVGSDEHLSVDVRILAATNRSLREDVDAGRFRADLLHRLSVYPIRVPALRERLEDIGILANHFAATACSRSSGRCYRDSPCHLPAGTHLEVSPESLDLLRSYTWPGNVRELRHAISRAALRCASDPRERCRIEPRHLEVDLLDREPGDPGGSPSPRLLAAPPEDGTLRSLVAEFQRSLIRSRLDAYDGNWAATARSLGVNRSNLHRLGQRLGLKG